MRSKLKDTSSKILHRITEHSKIEQREIELRSFAMDC